MAMKHMYSCDVLQVDWTIQRFLGSLDKVAYERKKGIELSLIGVKAKMEETDKTRPLSIYEKVGLLEDLLKANGVLAESRPTESHGSSEFVSECCQAFRVVVPEDASEGRSNEAFSFWVSPQDENRGLLCLMEGNGGDRENPYNYGKSSTYTVLQSLVHFARAQRRPGIIDQYVANDAHPNEFAKVDESHPPSLVEQYHNVKPLAYDFATDPLSLLKSWRCDISSAMNVEFLYRVREFGPDSAHNWNKVTVFGYALCIKNAGS